MNYLNLMKREINGEEGQKLRTAQSQFTPQSKQFHDNGVNSRS